LDSSDISYVNVRDLLRFTSKTGRQHLLVPRDNWGLLGEGVWTRQRSVPAGLTKPCPFTIRYTFIFDTLYQYWQCRCCRQDVLKDAVESNMQSAIAMPYFEGDFWPNILEESIKELEQEEEDKRRREEVEAATSAADVEELATEKEDAGEVCIYTSYLFIVLRG